MTVPPALQPRFNAAQPYAAPGTGILSLSLSAMFVCWADALGAITIFYRLLLAALILFPFFVRCCRTTTPFWFDILEKTINIRALRFNYRAFFSKPRNRPVRDRIPWDRIPDDPH